MPTRGSVRARGQKDRRMSWAIIRRGRGSLDQGVLIGLALERGQGARQRQTARQQLLHLNAIQFTSHSDLRPCTKTELRPCSTSPQPSSVS